MFKKGQQVVKILNGAGYETASLQTIGRVSKGRVQCVDSYIWYDKDTGRESEPSGFAGFSSRLVTLEK